MKRKYYEIYSNRIKRKFISSKFIENKVQKHYDYNYKKIDNKNNKYFIFMYF